MRIQIGKPYLTSYYVYVYIIVIKCFICNKR